MRIGKTFIFNVRNVNRQTASKNCRKNGDEIHMFDIIRINWMMRSKKDFRNNNERVY